MCVISLVQGCALKSCLRCLPSLCVHFGIKACSSLPPGMPDPYARALANYGTDLPACSVLMGLFKRRNKLFKSRQRVCCSSDTAHVHGRRWLLNIRWIDLLFARDYYENNRKEYYHYYELKLGEFGLRSPSGYSAYPYVRMQYRRWTEPWTFSGDLTLCQPRAKW